MYVYMYICLLIIFRERERERERERLIHHRRAPRQVVLRREELAHAELPVLLREVVRACMYVCVYKYKYVYIYIYIYIII